MSQAMVPYFTPNLYFSSYPQYMQPLLEEICENSEALLLLNQVVQRLGKIAIIHQADQTTMAVWDWDRKTIHLSPKLIHASPENLAAYIIFELCNASKTDAFIQIANGPYDADTFVEKFERLEHLSALKTHNIAKAIFGEVAEFDLKHIHTDFKLHYALEQISGHSEEIAERYLANPAAYQGSLYYPLSELRERDRGAIYGLLYCKLHQTEPEFSHYLRDLRVLANTDENARRAVDCALLLFPDEFKTSKAQ